MLVLTRKVGEGIFLGEEIKVTVVRVDGRKVRLAIEAPREVMIRREELRSKSREKAVRLGPQRSGFAIVAGTG